MGETQRQRNGKNLKGKKTPRQISQLYKRGWLEKSIYKKGKGKRSYMDGQDRKDD